MKIKVSNLELFSIPFGVSALWNMIFQAKINFLDKLSKEFKDEYFEFYNVLGEFSTINKVNEILSAYFDNYAIIEKSENFNSSPINNIPIIEIDGERKEINTETVGIYYIENLSEIPESKYSKNILVIKEIISKKRLQNLPDNYIVISETEELDYKNLLERKVIDNVNDDTTQSLLLKLLRGDKVC